jgi:hypothetical protein
MRAVARPSRALRAIARLRAGVLAAGLTALALAAVAVPGCEGTSIGNPPGVAQAEIQLGLQGQAGIVVRSGELPDGGTSDDDDHDVTLDEVWLAFGDAGLLVDGQCGGAGATPIADDVGAFAAELVTGRVLPSRPTWSRPADERYCQLRTRLDGASAAVEGAPAELAGVTLYARGKRADGVPFVARVSAPGDIGCGPASGAFSLGSGPVGMVLVFDFDDWFEHLPLADAVVEGGVITIDATHNADLAKAVAAAVPPSARLFRDSDRNGRYEQYEGAEELGK